MGRTDRIRRVLAPMAAAALLSSLLLGVVAAPAAGAIVERHPVYGGGDALFGACPDEFPGPAGTSCVENYVLFWFGDRVTGGGSVSKAKAPLNAYMETARIDFNGTDEPDVTILRSGYVQGGQAYVDRQHLATARVTVQIPMSDGSTVVFDGEWVATSDRTVFGNDGPATGLPHHFDECFGSGVAIGHQKFRIASMTGTLNGVPVHSYGSFDSAAIFDNNFRYIYKTLADCP